MNKSMTTKQKAKPRIAVKGKKAKQKFKDPKHHSTIHIYPSDLIRFRALRKLQDMTSEELFSEMLAKTDLKKVK